MSDAYEYGRTLREFFLIFFTLCLAIVVNRFYSGQKSNPFLYFQLQLLGNIEQGSIFLSLIAVASSAIVLLVSIIVALWFVSWMKCNCSYKFWIVSFIYTPITLLFSSLPFCSFWLGTSILTGLDPCFLQQVEAEAMAGPWWNSCYLFGYLQLFLAFMIFHSLALRMSSVRVFISCSFLLLLHLLFFFLSCQLYTFSILHFSFRLFATFNFGLLLVYFCVLVLIKFRTSEYV